ncbi:MAG: PKD domain-containing protein, partial [Thermoplasmata archaeon]
YSKPSSTISPTYELPYVASYVVMDHDNELVTATWDFGDGTETAVNETVATEAGSFISQNHTWIVEPLPGIDKDDGYYIMLKMSVRFEDVYGHVIYSNHTVNITPPENLQPVRTFSAQSSSWSPGYELPFYASATDPEGDPITWTYVFNDTVEDYLTSVYHTECTDPGTTVWCNVTHTFSSVGEYYVTLFVSDALEPWQATNNLSQTIKITIVDNLPPGVLDTIVMDPTNPRINTTLGYAEVLFSTQAYDFDADVLYLTWDFGDGEYATNQSAGGSIEKIWFYQVHRYTVAGQYNATVLVDDGRGHTRLVYKVFNVTTTNVAPALRSLTVERSHGAYAAPDTPVNVTIVLYDFERDPLTVWVDFGDNSTVVVTVLSDFSANGTVTLLLSHAYNSTGVYSITITFTDGVFGATHNVTVQTSVEVKVPRVVVPRVWNWWDTVSLSLVFIGVGLIFARWYFLGRFRKELDKKGLSLEEYKTVVAELKRDRNVSLRNVDDQVQAKKLDRERARKVKAEIRDTYSKKMDALRAGTLAGMMGGG